MEENNNLDHILEDALLCFENQEKENQNRKDGDTEDVLRIFEDVSSASDLSKVFERMDEFLDDDGTDHLKEFSEQLSHLGKKAIDDQNNDNLNSILNNPSFDHEFSSQLFQNNVFQNSLSSFMSQLVSKNILYEPLCEMKQKYPEWLATHSSDLSEEDFERYSKQYDIIKQICTLYEAEDATTSTLSSTTKVLPLFSLMQNLGQPPPDLLKDLTPGMDLDQNGFPQIETLFTNANLSSDDCKLQ